MGEISKMSNEIQKVSVVNFENLWAKLMEESEVIKTQAKILKVWDETTTSSTFDSDGNYTGSTTDTNYYILFETVYGKHREKQSMWWSDWQSLAVGDIMDVTVWEHPEKGIVATKITSYKTKRMW
jgi:hypothetical protein